MKKKLQSLKIRLVGLILLFPFIVLADKQELRFDLLSIKQGLSQSSVNTILQDKQGFIWIGTQDGLNRYDGYSFEVFNHDAEDSTSICDNFIRAMALDPNGNLWVGTDFGISVFDYSTQTFESFYSDPIDVNTPSGNMVRSMVFDKDGMLWVGTANSGLYSFNTKTKQSIRYHEGGNNSLASDNILTVYIDNNNDVWVGTDGSGISRFNRGDKSFHTITASTFGGTNVIQSFYQDTKGYLWLGTSEGLFVCQDTKDALHEIDFYEVHLSESPHSITSIFESGDEQLWVGTYGTGLFKLIRDQDSLVVTNHFVNNNMIETSLADNIVLSLFEDRTGIMWVGTNSGINKFDPAKQSFKNIMSVEGSLFNLSDNTVWCIYEDEKFLWIGNAEGLDQIDKKTGESYSFSDISSSIHFRNNKSVLSIARTRTGKLLIGTVDGLYEVIQNGKGIAVGFKQINYNAYYYRKTETNRVYAILEASDGKIWVGTKKGLAILNSDFSPYGYYTNNISNPYSISGNTVRCIIEDSDNEIWVGTEGGLSRVSFSGSVASFDNYLHENKPGSLSNDIVMTGYQTKDKTLWFGTYGGGLNKFNKASGKFTSYKEKDGLSNNVVYGLLGDELDRLWMTTNKGLSMFDPVSEKFVVYHENDGLQSDEFNNGAYFQNEDGIMYFGGINGVSMFKPTEVSKNPHPPQMVFTNFKINNKKVEIGSLDFYSRHLNQIDKLEMSYKVNNFTFEFAALHYSFPEKNQYAYKMVGFDEDWNEVGQQRYAHYTNLSPGEYTLIVKGTNSDGVESENVASLNLIVTPPIWLTWWFWVLVVFAIAGATVLGIRYRINMIKAQKQALEVIVRDRTAEVTAQKEQIELQKNELQIEKEKSEKLLLNILPEETVDELKLQGKAKARNYRQVTVMFTDFKGFTKIAERLTPPELVEKLDSYFIKFDEIIEKYEIEKIKTIGDAYMCAGGIPIRNKSNPIEVVLAGLEIQRYVQELKQQNPEEEVWDLRLGIHTGELIAGVIGIKRFAYDIWGDTVNVAQRMESSSDVGKVNVSGETYDLIKSFFECTYRGKIDAKNKGEIDMYFVDRIKPELSQGGLGFEPNDVFWDYVDLELYSSINYRHAEKFIIKTLEEGLSKDLHYHNIDHMKDVCASVERIAKGEGIKGEDLFLLKTAALYHDGGFVEQYAANEPIGARMAKEALPVFGYSEEQLDMVEKLILATRVPQQPNDHLEEIMCDADLDYLGRDDFYPISENLKKEFIAFGVVKDNKTWDELQIKFLSAHKYFTKYSIQNREGNKQQRLKEIKERYARNEYS